MLLHNNRVGIGGNINFLTCFVRLPAQNSINPINQTTRFPARVILSRKMLKKVGERRHPCLTPTVVLNHSYELL